MGSRHAPLAKKMHKYGYFFTFMPYNLRFPAGTNSNLNFPAKFEFFPQNLKNDHNYSTQNLDTVVSATR